MRVERCCFLAACGPVLDEWRYVRTKFWVAVLIASAK